MEGHGGDVCFDLRGGCVKTQSAFTEIGHDTETGANVDASKRLYAVAGLGAPFRNVERGLGFLWGYRHGRTLLNRGVPFPGLIRHARKIPPRDYSLCDTTESVANLVTPQGR